MKKIYRAMAGIILALLLNELRNEKYKKVIQTFSYLPHFISWVTLSGLFIQLLSPSSGPIAAVVTALGGTPYYFMGEVSTFRWVLVVTNIWKSVGWGSIIYLAALAGVDSQLYEDRRGFPVPAGVVHHLAVYSADGNGDADPAVRQHPER